MCNDKSLYLESTPCTSFNRTYFETSDTTLELKKLLTNFAVSHNISLKEAAQLTNMILSQEMILERHKSPISQNERDKRWRTRLPNGKQLVKTRYDDLIHAIVDYYSNYQQEVSAVSFQESLPQKNMPLANQSVSAVTPPTNQANNCTLKSLYPEWLELRQTEVSKNTLADDIRYWTQYIATSTIASTPLSQLTRPQLKTWANQLIRENSMKRKYFENIRTVLNSLLDYAVDEEYVDTNKFRSIKLNSHLYKPTTFKEEHEEAFTEEEQALVMKEAEQDSIDTNSAIPLGICILFLTGMRIGELCGLRYGDIRGDSLYISRMVIAKQIDTSNGLKCSGYEIVEHAKSSAGQRRIPLTTKAREYFCQIKKLNERNGFSTSDTDLVFQRKGGMCNQRVYDSHLKKYCNPNHLNLPFAKSCHDIRRSYISHLFDLGLNPDEIRRIAGHENIEMTMRYCRGRKSQDELVRILEEDCRSKECNRV